MENELRSNLLLLAETYAKAKDFSLTTIARNAAGDWRFFDRLNEESKTFTARKYDEVVQWFSDNWPADLGWPDSIVRPAHSAATEHSAA